MALGCATHCLGDAITKEGGVPFLAPLIPLGGKRWWEQRLPSFLSIRAGGNLEKILIGPALTVLTAWLIISAFDGAPGSDLRGLRSDGAVSFGKLLLRNHWHRNHICSTFVPDMNRVG